MDRAWLATVHGVPKCQTRLSAKQQRFHCIYVPHLYPFLCWWASRLLPCLGQWVYASFQVSLFLTICPGHWNSTTRLSVSLCCISLYSPQICHWCWFSVITLMHNLFPGLSNCLNCYFQNIFEHASYHTYNSLCTFLLFWNLSNFLFSKK